MSKLIEQQREHFDSIAERYYKERTGEKQQKLHELLYEYFFENLKKEKKFEKKIWVLEPMCGFAEGKKIISKYLTDNIEYTGFDYSEKIVECAKENEPGIDVFQQDVTTFYTNKRYDVIIIIGGLHHVPNNVSEVLKNMYSMLNDGGFFINIEPTYNNFLYNKISKFVYKHNDVFDDETERRFSLKELNDYYVGAGFKIYEQIYPGLLAYVLWYNPDVFPGLNKGKGMVEKVFNFDKKFFRNGIGRKLSFATFTICKKI